jgi:hypothetical protein
VSRQFAMPIVLCGFITVASAAEFQHPERETFHLFVLAGQSNMAGRGAVDAASKVPHSNVWMLDLSVKWVPAVDPMHFDKPSVIGVGPGLSFAIAYANAHPGVTVGLIPCAVGGSPIAAWRPAGYHASTKTHPWDDATKRIAPVLSSGVMKGVLWHQGESDAKPDLAAAYTKELNEVVRRFRKLCADPTLPFIAGQMGQFSEQAWNDAKKQVDAAHRSLPDRVAHTGFASSNGLTHKGDEIHFDTRSTRILGRRYFEAFTILQHP